ncbi:MAG: murein transglycosylase A [Cyanomargarita calcarea GSE-NOS-MK-12-04C]|jgi:membrane-bound lytic murein transglycosylase A|uniref:peptidoglycan lytic exotransglycosylase n=1 Tax=Cyanomargarita calcarea GSE-NOS-MK-12-04C TaxID=2839659 RepID=A0A951QJK9_9CYAN|nr:murein transglycosylase A [Cyanomargarita calcarea GSE-NOS-MK-12-04C]
MKTYFNPGTVGFQITFLCLLLLFSACNNQQDKKSPQPVMPLSLQSSLPKENNYFLDNQIWGESGGKADKENLLKAIDNSLSYLKTKEATEAYQNYVISEITQARVEKSLKRFRELVVNSKKASDLQAAVNKEFVFYKSTGSDNKGSILFTGYYKPIYLASRVPTPEYRYPIYRLPDDFQSWTKPHPTRLELEGEDALQSSKGKLRGLELFWLRSRMDAFLAQVQGSAVLQFTDKTQTSINYAGNTEHDYVSLGKELIKDGKLSQSGITLQKVIDYLEKNPESQNVYLPRNPRFIFFKDTKNAPAIGSLNVAVTPERSIATDKSLMPPGALALIRAPFPFVNQGKIEQRLVSRYVLDQDTGGAIKSPGRVDYYLGVGKEAGERAGAIVNKGELYYFLLKAEK